MKKAVNKRLDQECIHDWKEVNQKLGYGRIQLNLSCRKCRCTIVEIYSITKKYIIGPKGEFLDTVEYQVDSRPKNQERI